MARRPYGYDKARRYRKHAENDPSIGQRDQIEDSWPWWWSSPTRPRYCPS